jgi:hypothetical protein
MRKLVALVAAVGVGALAVGTTATAGRPTHTTVNVDDEFTIPAAPEGPCAFAIQGHFTGTIKTTEFFDSSGNLVRAITAFPKARVTFSANGKSISTVTPSVEHVNINPDGSATVTITGLSGHLITGGGPPLAADVGRIVLFFSSPTDEEPDLIFQVGQFNDGPFPQLCDVLAP